MMVMMMADGKEKLYWDLGSEKVNVNCEVLEKSIWVIEKSWKSPGKVLENCLWIKMGTKPED